jgi:hypothetical protein
MVGAISWEGLHFTNYYAAIIWSPALHMEYRLSYTTLLPVDTRPNSLQAALDELGVVVRNASAIYERFILYLTTRGTLRSNICHLQPLPIQLSPLDTRCALRLSSPLVSCLFNCFIQNFHRQDKNMLSIVY